MTDNSWPFGLLEPRSYGTITVDPPWRFESYSGGTVPQRAKDQHYDTMTPQELAALPVSQLAGPNCALLMWGISSHLPHMMWLAKKWGFTFSSKAFCWAKTRPDANDELWDRIEKGDWPRIQEDRFWHFGLGHTTRKNTEDCWLFKRGRPKRISGGVRELIVSPLREHSRKPDEFYDRAERLYPGPYVDLFSRTPRKGWSAWGNETEKFG